jgi:hypothetical protein
MSSEAPLLSDSVGGEHAIQTERINMDINRFILNFAQILCMVRALHALYTLL